MFVLRDRDVMKQTSKFIAVFSLLTFFLSMALKFFWIKGESLFWYMIFTYVLIIAIDIAYFARQIVNKKKSAFSWSDRSRRLNICLIKEVFDFNLAWFYERFLKTKFLLDPLQLKLELEDTQIKDAPWNEFTKKLDLYRNVEYFIFSVKHCITVTESQIKPIFTSIQAMDNIKTVNMSFTNTSVVENSLESLMKSLSEKSHLSSFHINLKNFSHFGAHSIGLGLQNLKNLESLHIFTDLRTDYELRRLVSGLGNLGNLESLKLSFENISFYGLHEIFQRLNPPRLAFLKIMTKKLLKPEAIWDELDYKRNILKIAVTKLKTMRYFELCIIGKAKRHALCGLSEFCGKRNRLMAITKVFKENGLKRSSNKKILKRYDHILDILELYY